MSHNTTLVRRIKCFNECFDIATVYYSLGKPVAYRRLRLDHELFVEDKDLKKKLQVLQHDIAGALRYRPIDVVKLELEEILAMDKKKFCKDTTGKLRLDYIPPKSQIAISKIREFGVKKYKDPWAWKTKVTREEFITAAKRHLLQIDLGEEIDCESNEKHLHHALTSLAMAVEVDKT